MDHDGAAPIEGDTREVAGHTITELLLLDMPAAPRRRERSASQPAATDTGAAAEEAGGAVFDEPWPGVPPLPWPADPPEAA